MPAHRLRRSNYWRNNGRAAPRLGESTPSIPTGFSGCLGAFAPNLLPSTQQHHFATLRLLGQVAAADCSPSGSRTVLPGRQGLGQANTRSRSPWLLSTPSGRAWAMATRCSTLRISESTPFQSALLRQVSHCFGAWRHLDQRVQHVEHLAVVQNEHRAHVGSRSSPKAMAWVGEAHGRASNRRRRGPATTVRRLRTALPRRPAIWVKCLTTPGVMFCGELQAPRQNRCRKFLRVGGGQGGT